MALLRLLDSSGAAVAEYRLDGRAEVWIGRVPENDIVLPSDRVSRRHARVVRTERGYEIVDNDSQNGILLGGVRVRSHVLKHGDIVVLGHDPFLFIDEPPPSASRQAPQPQPVPAPSPVPAAAPPRRSGCGSKSCVLGCLGVPLAGLALLFGLYVWWARPPWIAKFMFWRKSLQPQLELRASEEDVAHFAAQEKAFDEMRAARAAAARMSGLRTESYVRKTVTAKSGETFTTREGAVLRIPPNALARDAVVELAPRTTPSTPQLSGAWTLLSDVWVIRVDGREHSTFARPLTLEVPVALRSEEGRTVAPGALRALSWNGSSWEPHPARVQADGAKVRFEIRHASDTVVGTIKSAGKWVWDTGTDLGTKVGQGVSMITGTRSELEPWVGMTRFARYPAYRTKNFVIYYVPPGDKDNPNDAVAADTAYPLLNGRKPAEAPWFVIDIGTALEHARSNAGVVGVRPENLWAERITVLLEKTGAYGETPLGGPIYLDSAMNGVDPEVTWGEFVFTTATHEMMHVVQDEYFQYAEAGWNSALIETTAEALSELLRYKTLPKQHPSPYLTIRNNLNRTPDFLSTPIDGEGRGEKQAAYAWASFFIWAETEAGLQNFTSEVMKSKASFSGFASVPNTMASVVERLQPGQNLSTLFTRFASAYLHDDMRDAKFHSKTWWQGKSLAMTGRQMQDVVFRRPNVREDRSIYHFARTAEALDHLTARLDLFNAEHVRNDVPGKAYLRFHSVKQPGARVQVYTDRATRYQPDPQVPASAPQSVQVSSETIVEIPNFGNHPVEAPLRQPPNQISLVIVNDQPATDGLDFSYDAWLLLPPSNVQFDRMQGMVSSGGYQVNWDESPLAKSKEVFKGYNVYRRRLGDKEWDASPVNAAPLTQTRLEDWPQERVDHEYSATVVDAFGHESEKSLVESDDPFIGEWSGSLVLKEGSIVDASKWSDEEKQIWGWLIELLERGQVLLRMGVPLRFRLERYEGKYFFRPVRFLVNIEDVDPLGHFIRATKHNLEFVPDSKANSGDEPLPTLYFSLEYPNEIHNTYRIGDATFEWRLTRDKKR